MKNIEKNHDEVVNKDELERLYQVYIRVQSGDKSALNDLFKQIEKKQISKVDEMNKEYRMSHMDNVLDMEAVLENEKNKQEEEWTGSMSSNVAFTFSCLSKMINKKKKKFLSRAKNTGYEDGKKIKNCGNSKFYEGEYDISDFNELMYETIIEIFNEKTDEYHCLTLDGKKNEKYPICDGLSLLRNISYFTSRKINKRAKNSYLDIFDTESLGEESDSNFDKYAYKKFIESERGISRLMIYAEYLAWLRRYDIHKLFKANACDIHALIDTIMNNDDVFMKDMSGDNEIGLGMRLVTQEMLHKIIKTRHEINIEQENISKDLEIIEQRLLDHLFYSLIYRIDKAEESKGIYKKESERFLNELDEKRYIKVFSRTSYEIYGKSVDFINSDANSKDYERYFRIAKKYEDMIISFISLEKGKKKYDMINLLSDNDDLVDDKRGVLLNIAETIILYYQQMEEKFENNELGKYTIKDISDWKKGYWDADFNNEILKIKLFSSKEIKKPIQYEIRREKIKIYSGCRNFYICNMESEVCYKFPKNRRIISRTNKNHEIFMYNVG